MSTDPTVAPAPVDTCHCCEQTDAVTAGPLFNPPGLSALSYRVGVYGGFFESMIQRLSQLDLGTLDPSLSGRVLSQLTTRDASDPTLALVDAWASALDVLTFYQERIANESFLRTATERRSVLELARQVGYELAPGLAASVDLAFTAETVAGQPHEATIEVGTKVMSVPGQNEKPQTFETIESVEVRGDWNQLKALPPTADPALPPVAETGTSLAASTFDLYIDPSTPVVVGDALLFNPTIGSPGPATPTLASVVSIQPSPATGSIRVSLNASLPQSPSPAAVHVLRQRTALFGHNAPDWRALSDQVIGHYGGPSPPASDPPNFTVQYPPLDIDTFNPRILPNSWIVLATPANAGAQPQTFLFQVVSAAGATRSDFGISTRVTQVVTSPAVTPGNFAIRTTAVFAQSERLTLGKRPAPTPVLPDRQFPQPSTTQPPNPGDAAPARRSLPLLAPPPTVTLLGERRRVTIVGQRVRLRALSAELPDGTGRFAAGDVFILLESVQLLPVQDPSGTISLKFRWLLQRLSGEQLEFLSDTVTPTGTPFNLSNVDPNLANDALHSVLPAAPDDPLVGETLELDAFDPTAPATLVFSTLPRLVYDRATVSVFGNIVRATHGETVAQEVLGSGGSIANLQFALKRKPLTYISSASATGVESSLSVRVNEVEWHEVPSLFGLGPRQRKFEVRVDDDRQVNVIFGDGTSGARPPTGVENIVATYRTGIGPEGMVRANQLTLQLTRTIGVRSVTNPLPAFDGVGPATIEQARTNTPLNVRSTGRVVSVLDAEDFARTFAGIGNAQAVLLGVGNSRIIHLTVAAANGEPVSDGSSLIDTLHRAITAVSDPSLNIVIDTFEELPFVLKIQVTVDPDFESDEVVAAANQVLTTAFGVTARPFGGLVTEAEILTLVQGVPGVIAASVVDFRREADGVNVHLTALQPLPAHLSAGGSGSIVRAQVAVLALGNPTFIAVSP